MHSELRMFERSKHCLPVCRENGVLGIRRTRELGIYSFSNLMLLTASNDVIGIIDAGPH